MGRRPLLQMHISTLEDESQSSAKTYNVFAGTSFSASAAELATPSVPTRDALEARIAVVERAEDLGAIATSIRAILKLVRP